MLAGSRIRDEVRRVLIPLQEPHALTRLQSQLHQRSVGYLLHRHSDHTGLVCMCASLLRATGIICSNLPDAAKDQYVTAEQTGSDFSCNTQMTYLSFLQHSKTMRIDYAWL